jgi:hypothetical protein
MTLGLPRRKATSPERSSIVGKGENHVGWIVDVKGTSKQRKDALD